MSYTPPTGPATTLLRGVVRLNGDLAGTADSPTVAKVNGVTLPGAAPTTGQVLTATSGTATSWSTPTSGFADPLTTKGDIIVRGASTTRLPVGSDNQVLVADSAQANGIKWGTVNDATAVKLAGSTMTGKLVLSAATPLQVTTGSPGAGKVLTSDASGNASWSAPAGSYTAVVTKTANYTAANGELILVNAAAAAVTITLPAVAAGGKISVKKIDSSAFAVTVATGSAVLIDGATSWTTSIQWQSQDFYCDGTQWWIV